MPSEASSFLDWLDKVRVGLWLGYNMLGKDAIIKVRPSFHINRRIGAMDRMLVIYKTDQTSKGINFIGVDTFAFRLIPSCFALRVNEFFFLNISTGFLVAKGLGFPYPRETRILSADPTVTAVNLGHGSHIVKNKILSKPLPAGGLGLYQPKVYRSVPGVDGTEVDVSVEYSVPHIKDYAVDFEQGIGPIFTSTQDLPMVWDGSPKTLACPKTHSFDSLGVELATFVYQFQTHLLDKSNYLFQLSGIPSPPTYDTARQFNAAVLKLIREGRALITPVPPK